MPDDRPARTPEPLPPGTPAPPFRLPSADAAAAPPGAPRRPEHHVSLDSLRGHPVVLVFYPGDFTPVCGSELTLFSEMLPDLEALGAKVYGISADSPWSHAAFAKERSISVPLLSDFQPRGEVARRYRCWREEDGVCERATFVLDGEGRVAWSAISAIDVNPGVDGVFDALERLQAGPGDARAAAPAEARP